MRSISWSVRPGTIGDTLTITTADDRPPPLRSADPSVLVTVNSTAGRIEFRATNRGTTSVLADADGITVTGRPLDDGWSLEPGAGARVVNGFSVPAGFVPTKLLLVESAHPKSRAFRITLKPGDLPGAPGAPGSAGAPPNAPPPAPTAAP